MWFGVLGPLEVRDDAGRVVRVGGSVRRELLAALLCRAGEFVSAASLIEDVWGEVPPRTAAKTLQSHLVRLRQDLAQAHGAVIRTENAGYKLELSAISVDAVQFEKQLNEGLAAFGREDNPLAIKHLDAALALWRGEAYVDFAEAAFALGERVRLADLRAVALETRTDAALRLGRAATLIADLEDRIRRAPYRERSWEQLMLALYRSGRQADALAAYRKVQQRLSRELGVDPGPELRALEMRILNQDPALLAAGGSRPPVIGDDAIAATCPYRGLAGYDSEDAGIFVGRERLVAMLAGRLADSGAVVVAGASGSGKSSAVRAGLIPALRSGALPQSAAWRVVLTTPTTKAGRQSEADVLVVDQAEELFTVLGDPDRTALLERLRAFVEDGRRLVVVLRGDFFAALAEVPWLARYAQREAILVGRMREDELARVIIEPARRAGVTVSEDVVETILDESAGQAQPLPLISVALVRAWAERKGDVITAEAYRASGGLAAAIETTAEATFSRLSDASQSEARRLLVRMATREGAAWVRRPLPRESLPAGSPVLDVLAEGRLITVTEGRAELSHDALLEHWPRLRRWLDERMIAAELLEHLTAATHAWLAGGRHETDLHRGPRLRAALEWREAHPDDLSVDESDFLTASAAAQEALEQSTLRSARRTTRRLRLLVTGLGVILLAAVAGGLIAVQQRTTARKQALQADAVRIATLAGTLPGNQRDVALLLGVQGYRLHPSDETAGGLQSALLHTPPGLERIIAYRSTAALPHLDHTGRLLAVPGQDGTVTIDDLVGARARILTSSTPREFAVFSGDDRWVAAGGPDGQVVVWDANTGAQSGKPLQVGGGDVHPVFATRNDKELFVIDSRGLLSEWNRSNPEHPSRVRNFDGYNAGGSSTEAPDLTESPDGQWLAAGDIETHYASGVPVVWDTRSGKIVKRLFGSLGSFAADGHTVPLGFGDTTVLANARTGQVQTTVPNTDGSALAVVSPDGGRVAVSQSLHGVGVVSVYDVRTHHQIAQPLELQSGRADPVGFLPDGRLVTTGAAEAAVWTVATDVPPLGVRLDTSTDRTANRDDASETPTFLSGSDTVAVVGHSSIPIVYDPVNGRALGPVLSGVVRAPVAASPDGRLLVGERTTGGGIGIWDLRSGRLLSLLPGATTGEWDPPTWSPHADLVALDIGGTVEMWHVTDPRHPSGPERIAASLGEIGQIAFTSAGRKLVAESTDSTISLLDVASGRIDWTRVVREGASGDIELSPDGATIAFTYYVGNTGHLQLLETATGTPRTASVLSTTGGFGYVHGGRWLIVSDYAGAPQAQLYDASTLEPIGAPFPTRAVRLADSPIDPMAVNGTGTMFAETTNVDPLLWRVDPDTWLKIACAIAGRNLTRTEWHRYLPNQTYQRSCEQYPAP